MTVHSRPRASTVSVVVAAAGYGKSSWAESETQAGGRVLEDLHALPSSEQAALVRAALAERTADEPLVLTSRRPLDADVRALLPGPVRERGPADLSLTPQEIAAVLAEEYAVTDPEVPSRVHALTCGWPTLVHLAADVVARLPSDDLLTELARPGSTAMAWLEHDVLDGLPAGARSMLSTIADLDLVTPDLVTAVRGLPEDAESGEESGAATYGLLVALGLLAPHPRDRLLGRSGHQPVPVLAAAAAAATPPDLWERAARWYDEHDAPFAAAAAYTRAGDEARARSLLAARGTQMVANGDAAGIVRLVCGAGPPPRDLDPGVRRTLGEALNTRGESYAALGAMAPLIAAADQEGWDAGMAVRVAAVHFSQGDLTLARTVLDRVPPASMPDEGDGVQWRALSANVASMLGDDDQARSLAAEALRLAEAAGEPRDLAAAHQAIAKTSAGSRKAAHLQLALSAARQGGDAVALARILGNQTYALLAAVRCDEAVTVGREAVRATELVRPMGALIAALHNLAEALTRTGEYDEARWHLRRIAAVSQRTGPSRGAASLCGLGDVHRALGRREQGRAAYQEAISLSRGSRELQVLVPALAGLARLIVADSPAEARTAAEEALEVAPESLAPYAFIALGWVELATGAREVAAEHASRAVAAARDHQALDLLADALELTAETEPDPVPARAALDEALSIWRGGGAEPDAARLEVLLGRLEGADREARAHGRQAAQRLQRLGITRIHGRSLVDDPVGQEITVSLLGRFEVSVGGTPVALQAWRSRQARTLVKVLAARRGRPVSRSELCEVLWPDDDPVKTSHRLSVLLTTVRGVLDPGKAWPPDRYVASDSRGLWLDLRRVGIDAVELLADAEHGADLLAGEELETASEVLAGVDARFKGEPFEDDPFEGWVAEDWAVALREETRAAWLRSLRHLATVATKQGRSNDASAILVRLLAVDPYDERVHRGLVRTLVRAGRHGEARRAFDRWTEAMTTVDAPPPDPAELVPRPRGSG